MPNPLDFSAATEQRSLKDYTEKAYLDYSMYVILDRALPHVGDGLKPVQRRIVYAMSELGLKAGAKYKKSARTVGDVIGKFHPHGDSAAYEAMVLMAQPFSYRYPLVDGQGNWGSPDDPKSFAAMRYTESKLSKYANLLLAELGQGTADWVPNFDGTLDEPEVLPARVPNVLLNGTTGIAVGMATDIPPHNLNELVSACIHLLEQPDATLADLCEHVQGPDYPTDAEIITPKSELYKLYETGRGSVKMRAVYEVVDGEIIVTALPFQASPSKILEQIAAQMQAKKLPMVSDLRDEADHENPIRLAIVPRSSRIDCEALMAHLFASTDLEKSYRVNLNMIGLNGKPGVRNLKAILTDWLSYRTDTVRRRLQFRLDKILKRLHILEGLLIAYLNIDEVIEIIRNEDKPKLELMQRFGLSDTQADAILDLRLRNLAKLEEMAIKGEQDTLAEERDALNAILGSKEKLRSLIQDELKAAAEEFGDPRRAKLVERSVAKPFTEADLLSSDPVTVVLSEKGWIRAAKGHDINPEALNFKSGDSFSRAVRAKSNETIVLLDSSGRSYSIAAHTLPSARGQGEPVTGKINPASGVTFQGLLAGDGTQLIVMASDAGYGFVTRVSELYAKNKNGKAILSLPKGAKVVEPITVNNPDEDMLIVISNDGRLLAFPVSDLPTLSKGKGNKLISITASKAAEREEFVIAMAVMSPSDVLRVTCGGRYLRIKFNDLDNYIGERGRRGNKLPRGYQKVDTAEVEAKP